MTALPTLEILERHCQDLLLAEVGALIHNIGKLSLAFVKKQGGDASYQEFDHEPIIGVIRDYANQTGLSLEGPEKKALRRLVNHANYPLVSALLEPAFKQWAKNVNIALPAPLNDRGYVLADFIDLQSQRLYPDVIRNIFPAGSRLTHLEAFSHGESSGLEKQERLLDKRFKQKPDDTFISSAFGLERKRDKIDLSGIDEQRNALLRNLQTLVKSGSNGWRNKLLTELQALRKGLGDTRRPANDVTLWDFNYSTACLLKPAVATVLLDGWREPADLRWRLLRVNVDLLGLYAKAIKIGDLLGYRHVVDKACKAVKKLVEEEYPLGNEIYRDTTGIYFTFPDLDLPAELAQEIRRRVEAVEPELAPRIAVTVGDGNTAQEQLKGILGKARKKALQALDYPFDKDNLTPDWQQAWQNVSGGRWEICPVCGLRPKLESAEACDHCLERRKGRLKKWLKGPKTTIWTNEVSDENGHLALIVGKFDLDDWLSGDLVQTLLVKADPASNTFAPKNASPARIRRVWETTQRFWKTALDGKDEQGKPLLPFAPPRLILSGMLTKQPGAPAPESNQVYELLVHGFKLSVLWNGTQFIVCDSPSYFKQTAGKDLKDALTNPHPFDLFTSEGYKKQDRKIGKFTIDQVEEQNSQYLPFIPILDEPQVFMALVPADRALPIVQAIRQKYETEMGKVRNRLPLHLGLVFATRRMPLQAVMDAGRAMLNKPFKGEQWELAQDVASGQVQFKNGITWNVKTTMGDDNTPDEWYPYFFVKQVDPVRHPRRFQLRKEGNTDPQKVGAVSAAYADRWLVHVDDLKQDDVVSIMPSRFDFEFLDSTARRYEIYYDSDGRRPRRTRPYYLEDLERLETLWTDIAKLKRSQFKQRLQTIEAARERWQIPEGEAACQDDVFKQFAADTLANTNWPKGRETAAPSAAARNDKQTELIRAAVRGELTDWAELHLEILEEDLKGKKEKSS